MATTKIIGFRTLNKKITEAFKQMLDDDINIRFRWSETPCYRCDKNIIEYGLLEGSKEDIWFNEFIEERFGYKVENTFMITMLHEIGHLMTIDDIDGIAYEFCLREKERIEAEMQKAKTLKQEKILEWQYFSLPDEIVASAWAVEFIRDNEELVNAIWAMCLTAIHEFYAKNITEEG
jgi:hypothetical protein